MKAKLQGYLAALTLFATHLIFAKQDEQFNSFDQIPAEFYKKHVTNSLDYIGIDLLRPITFRGLQIGTGVVQFSNTYETGKPIPHGFSVTQAVLGADLEMKEIRLPQGSTLDLHRTDWVYPDISGSAVIASEVHFGELLLPIGTIVQFRNGRLNSINSKIFRLESDADPKQLYRLNLNEDLDLKGKVWPKGSTVILGSNLQILSASHRAGVFDGMSYDYIEFTCIKRPKYVVLSKATMYKGRIFINGSSIRVDETGNLLWSISLEGDPARRFFRCYHSDGRLLHEHDVTWESKTRKGFLREDAERRFQGCKDS